MRYRILAVDDDPNVIELLRSVLEGAGYEVLTAMHGPDALGVARKAAPDLIILDLVLPEMNGFTVCDRLRRDPVTAEVPVLMLTGLPGELPRLAGTEAGADDYIRKPFQIEALLSRVNSLLHRSRQCSWAWCRDSVRGSGRPRAVQLGI